MEEFLSRKGSWRRLYVAYSLPPIDCFIGIRTLLLVYSTANQYISFWCSFSLVLVLGYHGLAVHIKRDTFDLRNTAGGWLEG